ncbi:MAG: hypothetical protein C4336_08620 [Armatimonadota bacterium]
MTELNRFIESLRELIFNAEPLDESLRQAGLALRMLIEGWAHLSDETRKRLSANLDPSAPADSLEQVFRIEGKAIARASAQAASYRYPTSRDALHAYALLYGVSAVLRGDCLERACLLAPLVVPEAELGARASHLLEVFLRLQPFAQDQSGSALLLTLAFLHAHGADYPADVASLHALVENPSRLQSVAAPASPSPLTYPELIERVVADSKATLIAVENSLRRQALVPLSNLPATLRTALQPVPGPSSEWRYLTLQDLIWINTEIMGRPQPYSYERLEEATYYQYSYRQSRDVLLNCARFLWGYLKYRPFAQGNYATALIATLTLLHINGYEAFLAPEHAADWLLQIAQRQKHPLDAIRQIARLTHPSKQPIPLREHVHHLLEQYEPALHALNTHETPLPV